MTALVRIYIALMWLLIAALGLFITLAAALLMPLLILAVWLWRTFIRRERSHASHVPSTSHP
jgi:hypothetical protein